MKKEKVKQIMVVVFVVAGLILPQYKEEFIKMQADPEFIGSVVFLVTAVLAWFTDIPGAKKKDD
jgi:protein-S-isoprenylcysteine O-methyltransferase Ste14